MSAPEVRRAVRDDAPGMAAVHVTSWRETYRGLMRDEVLDDPGMLAWRERFWTAALTDPRYAENVSAVAVQDRQIVGIAMSGPATDSDAAWQRQLYVLYLLRPVQGIGAGTALLDAVLLPGESAGLWVADPNPRAQAFYRREGFVADGVMKRDDGVLEIRMLRTE